MRARIASFCVGLSLVASGVGAAEPEIVDLVPADRASWSATNLFAPITGLFLGGPGYWYRAREVRVETTPPGADLDLFYVRANFQKRFEQAAAPALIKLPSRVEAGPRDSVMIRAMLDGYRQQEVHVRVRSRETEVMIDLQPLPNSLIAFGHTYLVGRGTLSFRTKEALTFRLQKRDQGLAVVLTETGDTPEADATMGGVSSALVSRVKPQQLGQDLVVQIDLAPGLLDHIDTRSRQAFDPVRREHTFALDLVPEDRGAEGVARAQAALARIGPADVAGCAAQFDQTLRERLEPADLSRALTPSGSFVDPYLRAAMKRLGEVSPGGVIALSDGSNYRPAVPIELTAAVSQAGEARGYLALLRRFVAELEPREHRRATLRGLIAPEVGPEAFDSLMDAAELAFQRCLARG